MAMIACLECKKEISANAKTCPHCGSQSPTVGVAIEKLVMPLVVLGIIIWFAVSHGPTSGQKALAAFETKQAQHAEEEAKKEMPQEKIDRDLKSFADYYAENPIKEQLKAPSTAKFSNREVVKVENSYALVRMSVDAQNGFGTMIRERWCAIVHGVDGSQFSWQGSNAAIPCDKLRTDADMLAFMALNKWPGAAARLAALAPQQRHNH